ncbi:MAG: ferritin-like domain-containing protein [Pseudomonadota bacterium]
MLQFKSDKEREEIISSLQLNMNEEFRATMQYICHRISAKGRDDVLADSFKSAALDEMAHILFFSDLITKYGGTPDYTTWDIDTSNDLKAMLEKDVALEKAARQRYEAQLDRMKHYPELVTLLTSVLGDEEEHEEEFSNHLSKK